MPLGWKTGRRRGATQLSVVEHSIGGNFGIFVEYMALITAFWINYTVNWDGVTWFLVFFVLGRSNVARRVEALHDLIFLSPLADHFLVVTRWSSCSRFRSPFSDSRTLGLRGCECIFSCLLHLVPPSQPCRKTMHVNFIELLTTMSIAMSKVVVPHFLHASHLASFLQHVR